MAQQQVQRGREPSKAAADAEQRAVAAAEQDVWDERYLALLRGRASARARALASVQDWLDRHPG